MPCLQVLSKAFPPPIFSKQSEQPAKDAEGETDGFFDIEVVCKYMSTNHCRHTAGNWFTSLKRSRKGHHATMLASSTSRVYLCITSTKLAECYTATQKRSESTLRSGLVTGHSLWILEPKCGLGIRCLWPWGLGSWCFIVSWPCRCKAVTQASVVEAWG